MKCGFLDCNNPTRKGKNSCQDCDKRKEWSICSACRQPEPKKNETLAHRDTFFMNNFIYQVATKMRDKAPSQFQAEFDQILPDFKLSEAEKKLIGKMEKVVLDFLAEKGSKQDHEQWFNFCSVCCPELDSRMEDFANQHPEIKSLMKRMEEGQEKLQTVGKKIRQEVGKEKWDEIGEKAIEELQEEIGDNWKNNDGPTGPGNQDPNNDNGHDRPNPSQNGDNSAKITQLQQEINQLKTEIQDLKNPRNPSPPNPNTLQEKENKLKEKEKELEGINKNNNSPSNSQPSKNGNSNLLLYLGLGVMGVVIILLAALLISQKKKKKQS